ncbi:ROK family transcriptional regulator [Pedococcus sp.]|jgi:predicted NBD/HSP70 family sugar kinase|uniref:ROK family transcriptional regulator n=1 Tax=Pedococcus sp. TaxID=2860345 RepID=UPI002E14249A|nr:ROK family transcriptional regulator [Pedococcus sp.]
MSTGPGDILELIRRGMAPTRRDLQLTTGLSRITVAQRVDALIDAGLVKEAGEGRSTGGRRPSRLVFDVGHTALAVAAVDTRHAVTAITDLGGTVLERAHISIDITEGPQAVLGTLTESLEELSGRSGVSGLSLSGAGICVPGPVDRQTGHPAQPPIMPGWDGYPIGEHIGDALRSLKGPRFTGPVFVENDADAMAFGEYSSDYRDCPSLCLLKVSTGIGAGLVIGGQVYGGVDGGAGDIGHIRLGGETAVCQCGSPGCVAAVASGRAVARELTRRGIPARSGSDVGRLLANGQADAVALTHEAGRRIGEVMATVVSMVNPGILVVGGDLASTPLIGGLRETLYPRTLARATRNLDVRLSTLGADAGIVGMARIAADRLFSAEAVNSRLAG